jgi:hypothetical protein
LAAIRAESPTLRPISATEAESCSVAVATLWTFSVALFAAPATATARCAA